MTGWDWTTQNGDNNATLAEMLAAYSALTNRGRIADFHVSVWKDILAAIKKLRQEYGDTDWPTGFTHNEQTGSVITAASFMDATYAIPLGKDKDWSWINRVGRSDLRKGDNVYGQYFLDLTAEIERKANMTLLHPEFDTSVITETDLLIRVLQLLALKARLDVGVSAETTMHLYDLLPVKATDRIDTSMSVLVKKLLMLPVKIDTLIPTQTDATVRLLDLLNVDLGHIEHILSHRVRIPLITLLEARLPPQDRRIDIEAAIKLINQCTIGWNESINVSIHDAIRLLQLLRVKPISAQHRVDIAATVRTKNILTLAGILTNQVNTVMSLHQKTSTPFSFSDVTQHGIRLGVHRLDSATVQWSDGYTTNLRAVMASIYARSIGFTDSYQVEMDGCAWLQEPLNIRFREARSAAFRASAQLLTALPFSYTLSAQTAATGRVHALAAVPMAFDLLILQTGSAVNAHCVDALHICFRDATRAAVQAKIQKRNALPMAWIDSTNVNMVVGATAKGTLPVGGNMTAVLTDQYTAHALGLERVLFNTENSAEMSVTLKAPQTITVTADLTAADTNADVTVTPLPPVPVGASAQSDTQIDVTVRGVTATRVKAQDTIHSNIACSISVSGLTLLSDLKDFTLRDLGVYRLRDMAHNDFLLKD